MTKTLTYHGRLPGVVCSPALPSTDQGNLRLDVAAFVGFAERGPLDLPIAVEDINQYRRIFGGDVLLAQDNDRPVYAYLPDAVRSFFDNGGRRAYVVRVAGSAARSASFEIPGLRSWPGENAVRVEAAWQGSWSKDVRMRTQLLSQPLAIAGELDLASFRLPLDLTTGRLVQIGDLLRVSTPSLPAGLLISLERLEGASAVVQTVGGADEEIANLSGTLPILMLELLRFDLNISEMGAESPDIEHHRDLRFGQGDGSTPSSASIRPWWAQVLQPPLVPQGTPAPAGGATLRLRAPAPADGLRYYPVDMDRIGAADPADSPDPMPGFVPGDDGLKQFDPLALFLDARLHGFSTGSLMPQVEALTSLSSNPARLRGIHSLASIDEVAMIAIPDLVHRPWGPAAAPATPPDPPALELGTPDWSLFRLCEEPEVEIRELVPPLPDPLADRPILDLPAGYDSDPLLQVQQSLIELCAARADAIAVLGLPAHFTRHEPIEWGEALRSSPRMLDGAALSYGAVWHPWIKLREEETPALAPLRPMPPDGIACGTIARRELERGVWVAPANLGFRGPVAITPELFDRDLPDLFDAHINLVRTRPGIFTSSSAHTLATDPLLVQVSVRRLLIFIRKLALQLGQRYVFEPNNERFRSQVRSTFERLLSKLAARGALVAYAVTTDEGSNTQNDYDNGRFIVNLKIAPTSPIEFITVSLIRDREGLLDVLEG